ncbi:hypothetical protein [Ottowia sp.]|uniref:hypothetical protein n=1 Tax=Ottowia sp. TaxID=1898956 RepID=UPI002C728420|nr:hypothetical protein [Ottowia sp.]HOB65284.1 hypothetical protein [Ottowia sp.]
MAASFEELMRRGQEAIARQTPAPVDENTGFFDQAGRGLAAGLRGMGGQLMSAVGGVADYAGADQFARDRYRDAAALNQEAQQIGPRIGSFSQLSKEGMSLRNISDYVGGVLGQTAPSMALGIGSAIGARTPLGAMARATAAYSPLEAGDVVQKIQEANPGQQNLTDEQLARAALTGVASAGAQSIVPGIVGGKLGGAVGRAAPMSLRQAAAHNAWEIPMEGVSEGGSEALKQFGAAPDKSLDWTGITDAAIAGAIGGVPAAGLGTAGDYTRGRIQQASDAAAAGRSARADAGRGVADVAQTAADAAGTAGASVESAATQSWDALKNVVKAGIDGFNDSELGATAKDKLQTARGYIEQMQNDPNVQAQVKARVTELANGALNPLKRAEIALLHRELYAANKAAEKATVAAQTVPDAVKAMRSGLAGDPDTVMADTIANGQVVPDQELAAAATPEQALEVERNALQRATDWAVQKGEGLLTSANLSKADFDQLTGAVEALRQNPRDEASRLLIAGKVKARAALDSLAATARDLKEQFQISAALGEGKTPAKKSMEGTALGQVIIDRVLPRLPEGAVDDKEMLGNISEIVQNYLTAARNMENPPSIGGGKLQALDALAAKSSLNKWHDAMITLLGPDAGDVIADIYQAANEPNPDTREQVFANVAQLQAAGKHYASLHAGLQDLLDPGAATRMGDRQRTNFFRHLERWANGELDSNAGPNERTVNNAQMLAVIDEAYGPNAPAAMRLLETNSKRLQGRGEQAPALSTQSGQDADEDTAAQTELAYDMEQEQARYERNSDGSPRTLYAGTDGQPSSRVAGQEGDAVDEFDPYDRNVGGLLRTVEHNKRLAKNQATATSTTEKKIKALQAEYPQHSVSFVTLHDYMRQTGMTREQVRERFPELKGVAEEDYGTYGYIKLQGRDDGDNVRDGDLRAMAYDAKRNGNQLKDNPDLALSFSRGKPRTQQAGETDEDYARYLQGQDTLKPAQMDLRKMTQRYLARLPWSESDNTGRHRAARAFMTAYADLVHHYGGEPPALKDSMVIATVGGEPLTVGDIRGLGFRPDANKRGETNFDGTPKEDWLLQERDTLTYLSGDELVTHKQEMTREYTDAVDMLDRLISARRAAKDAGDGARAQRLQTAVGVERQRVADFKDRLDLIKGEEALRSGDTRKARVLDTDGTGENAGIDTTRPERLQVGDESAMFEPRTRAEGLGEARAREAGVQNSLALARMKKLQQTITTVEKLLETLPASNTTGIASARRSLAKAETELDALVNKQSAATRANDIKGLQTEIAALQGRAGAVGETTADAPRIKTLQRQLQVLISQPTRNEVGVNLDKLAAAKQQALENAQSRRWDTESRQAYYAAKDALEAAQTKVVYGPVRAESAGTGRRDMDWGADIHSAAAYFGEDNIQIRTDTDGQSRAYSTASNTADFSAQIAALKAQLKGEKNQDTRAALQRRRASYQAEHGTLNAEGLKQFKSVVADAARAWVQYHMSQRLDLAKRRGESEADYADRRTVAAAEASDGFKAITARIMKIADNADQLDVAARNALMQVLNTESKDRYGKPRHIFNLPGAAEALMLIREDAAKVYKQRQADRAAGELNDRDRRMMAEKAVQKQAADRYAQVAERVSDVLLGKDVSKLTSPQALEGFVKAAGKLYADLRERTGLNAHDKRMLRELQRKFEYGGNQSRTHAELDASWSSFIEGLPDDVDKTALLKVAKKASTEYRINGTKEKPRTDTTMKAHEVAPEVAAADRPKSPLARSTEDVLPNAVARPDGWRGELMVSDLYVEHARRISSVALDVKDYNRPGDRAYLREITREAVQAIETEARKDGRPDVLADARAASHFLVGTVEQVLANAADPANAAVHAALGTGYQGLGALMDTVVQTTDNSFMHVLARGIAKVAGDAGVVTTNEKRTGGAFGYYNTGNHSIVMLEDMRAPLHTLMHEGVHAATIKGLMAEPALYTAAEKLLDHVLAVDPGLGKRYAATNVLEFIAEGMANPYTQERLKAIPASAEVQGLLGKVATAWDAFVAIARRALGLGEKHTSALSQMIDLGAAAMKATQDSTLTLAEVKERRAALQERAKADDTKLFNELKRHDNPKELQRAVKDMNDADAPARLVDAGNARIRELLNSSPKAAYAAGTVRYSMDATRPGTQAMSAQQQAEAKAYVEKVLGPKAVVEFVATMGHAGEYHQRAKTGEHVLRLATTALDPMGTAHHEALHGVFQELRDLGIGDVQKIVEAVAQSPVVMAQLRERLKHSPEALKQLGDPEEAAAFAYQFWSADPKGFKLGAAPRSLFERVQRAILKVLGIMTNDERALAVFEYLEQGGLVRDGNNVPAIKRATLEIGRNRAVDALNDIKAPLERLYGAVLSAGHARVRDMENASLTRIADLVKLEHTSEGADPGYLPAARVRNTEQLNKLGAMFEGVSEDTMGKALAALQTETSAVTPEAEALRVQVRAYLDDMFTYLRGAGVVMGDTGYGKNYFPRVWSPELIARDPKAFRAMLDQYQLPRGVMTTLLNQGGYDIGLAVDRPGMQASKTRELAMISGADAEPFMVKDLRGILTNYTRQATKRAEWARRFGSKNERLDALLAQAEQDGATADQLAVTKDYLKGVTGTLGGNIDPRARQLMGNMLVYQNIRLLPLALFSSIVDPIGIVVRGGTVGDAWRGFTRGMKESVGTLLKKDYQFDDATQLAETLGVIESSALSTFMSDMYSEGATSGLGKKINEQFFRWNLMEQYTRSTRVAASQAAMKFIERHVRSPNRHSDRYLAELGLSRSDFDARGNWLPAAEDKYAVAINRWVDGAILRPDAADRTIWMNDPNWMLVAHFKQFIYSFQHTILDRVLHEVKAGNYGPAVALAGYVPVMIAADYVRGLIQGGGEEPEWKKNWGAWDYISNGVERAGLYGVGQFGTDFLQDIQRGGVGVGALAGPTVEQLVQGAQVLGGRREFESFALKSMPANALYRGYVTGGHDETREPATQQ